MTEPEPRTPHHIRCGKCRHVWVLAWLPMECRVWVSIAKAARCPMCGNGPKELYFVDDVPVPYRPAGTVKEG